MALCPFAKIRLVNRPMVPMWRYFRINHHQAVTKQQSLFNFANTRGNPYFHFFVDEHGNIEQYVDTMYQAAADLDGNDATISIEAWDDGGFAAKYTPEQVTALIKLNAWLLSEHTSIPRVLAKSSRIGENQGISWHRLGVPYRTTPRLADARIATEYREGWLLKGGVWYSKASGKTCPGDGRIYQIKTEIFPGALTLLAGGGPINNPLPGPAPVTPTFPSRRIPEMIIIKKGSSVHTLVLGDTGIPISAAGAAAFVAAGVPIVAPPTEDAVNIQKALKWEGMPEAFLVTPTEVATEVPATPEPLEPTA